MPAYLSGYGNLKGFLEVEFRDTPTWKFDSYGANWHRDHLRQQNVAVGDDHRCDFSIEQLSSGGFAVICGTHPKRPVN